MRYGKKYIFIIAAVLFIMAAIYHLWFIFYPNGITPAWRHALFIGINLFCVYGVLNRPAYFFYFFLVVGIQQFYSHGSYLLELWQQKGELHWISVVDLIVIPVLGYFLLQDLICKKKVN